MANLTISFMKKRKRRKKFPEEKKDASTFFIRLNHPRKKSRRKNKGR